MGPLRDWSRMIEALEDFGSQGYGAYMLGPWPIRG